MSIQVQSPVKSPSLNQNGPAILVDENGYQIPVIAVVVPDSSGNSGLVDQEIVAGQTSQVTALQDPPLNVAPASKGSAPVFALVQLNADGSYAPFAPAHAGVAASVSGKFQSTELTGTGASQNVAHGLGVVPSLVLVSVQDTNGVALPHAIVEGVHTITNIVLTVTSGVKFKVIAFV